MDELVIDGGYPLKGKIKTGGAKNSVLPALVAALLTDQKVEISNIPYISDLLLMREIAQSLGASLQISDHKLKVNSRGMRFAPISLEAGAKLRTSFMMIVPLLCRFGAAAIPNPGGCRIGARPVSWLVEGLKSLGVSLEYKHDDGYFYAQAKKLTGNYFRFPKNSHMGTEVMILAAVLAEGKTVLANAAEEPEVDDLIKLLSLMGAKIKRNQRQIEIEGVKNLKGANFKIMNDRNEAVTLAVAALATHGDVLVEGTNRQFLNPFLEKLTEAGAGWEEKGPEAVRFFYYKNLKAVDIMTSPYPGFMTDWQSPWSVLMTQAKGESVIHETIYENRFQYLNELAKMGVKVSFFNPQVKDPSTVYNFDLRDDKKEFLHAARISGPINLHNAFLTIPDLRAGATLVLASLVARGKSYITGVELLDRGYEKFEERLQKLGAKIERRKQ